MATSSSTKQRALLDAQRANAAALAHTVAASQPPPPYHLVELIGKGSFGRVYKARRTTTTTATATPSVVAVKVIDIERGDAAAPGLADTLADLQTELRALRALRGASNVNHMLEALLVGPAVWLVVEYCAGGSVATLMRPVRDDAAAGGTGGTGGGLRERWIVPVLRETAAALAWVHARGVIHRDVKAANVLVAEDGRGVQLCDFGVAAMLRGAAEKRTTLVGTPHAMAPELLTGSSAGGTGDGYGTEVDVWAFGALAYELATGRPPNAALGVGLAKLGRQLQMETPRLPADGGHSDGLRDLVACCLRRDPAARPTMEAVRGRHAYLAGTEAQWPTASLAQLVRAFRLWEAQGGDRRSLFADGGAAATHEDDDGDDDGVHDWNFSTAVEADVDDVLDASDSEALAGAYGIESREEEELPQQTTYRRRRRRPPPSKHAAAVKSPLEKVFDSNTLSNYDEYSRQYYAKFLPAPVQQALLHNGVAGGAHAAADRDSLIDLDLCLVDGVDSSSSSSSSNSAFNSVDLGTDTIRPAADGSAWGEQLQQRDGGSMRRATQDWKFPSMFSQPPALSSSPPRWDEAASSSDASQHSRGESLDSLIDLDLSAAAPPPRHDVAGRQAQRWREPPAPPRAPLPRVMLGEADDEQVKEELHRLTASLAEHLRYATVHLADLPIGRSARS